MSEEKKMSESRAYQKNTKNKKKVKNKKKHGFVWYALWTVFSLMLIGVIGVSALVGPRLARYYSDAKEVVDASTEESFHMNEASYLYDSEGNVMAKLQTGGDSVYLTYDQIPQDVVNAFVAIEDNSFWTNPGFDLKGIIRVGLDFVLSKGQTKHGASTITQQLARNVFLTHEVSLERKAKELMLAYLMTKKYTKEQIMEFYVNDIYFANGFYGIEAAAKGYFNKKTESLSLSQIAYLCAIPNRPNYYDPFGEKNNALKRRNKILKDMKSRGDISAEAYSEAALEEIEVVKTKIEQKNYEVTFGIHCAVLELMEQNGFEFQYHFDSKSEYSDYMSEYNDLYEEMKGKLYTGGYQVYTSIDPKQQEILQQAVDANLLFDLEANDEGIFAFQGAATVIDNSNGKVTAIVGGRSQSESGSMSLNRAYQSYRQPGSTMKPVAVYTPAMQEEKGYTPDSVLHEIDVKEAKEYEGKEAIAKVAEMDGPDYLLREAVEQSKNGCAYQLFNTIGIDYGLSFLEKMHFAKIVSSDYNLSASLGGLTYGTTTLEMASAYATIANYGEYRGASCIISMKNNKNEELHTDISETVYEEMASQAIIDVMAGVMIRGTGATLDWNSDIEAIGKTGTTNDSKDGWFCGATPYYTISVWCGYDQPRALDSLYGGSYPGHIWKQAMEQLVADKEAAEFIRPEEASWLHAYESLDRDEDEDEDDAKLLDEVRSLAESMQGLDPNAADYESQVKALYEQGKGMISAIKDKTVANEAKGILEAAYAYALSRIGEVEPSTEESSSTEAPSKEPSHEENVDPEPSQSEQEIQPGEDEGGDEPGEGENSGEDSPVEEDPVEEDPAGGGDPAEQEEPEAQNAERFAPVVAENLSVE